jgi:Protein of unknown function (DUF2505)
VRFHAEHQFSGSVAAVAARLVDPEFHRRLALPDLSLPEVLDVTRQDGITTLQLRYEYQGKLDPIAQRLLGSRRLTWLQELRYDHAANSGRLTFAAEAEPKQLHGSADFELLPDDEGGAVRTLDGELVVKVPLVGSMAERRIVPGLLRRLDVEAEALDDQLGG